MRIGIDARLWNETGVGRYTRNLVYYLAKIDKANEYVLFVKENDYDRIRNQESGIKENWHLVPTNIHWHSLEEQIAFPRVLNKEKLELMHFPYFSVPILYNHPFVVTIHDLIIYHFSTGRASTLPLPLYQLKRVGYKQALAHAVTHAKKIIVPLNAVKQDLIQTLNVSEERIAVTYEGIDLSLRAKRGNPLILQNRHRIASAYQPGKDKYFLYIGNAYPHKNLEMLIEGFVLFKRNLFSGHSRQCGNPEDCNNNDIKLALVGKEDYFYKRLHTFVKDKQVTGIEFLHTVTDAELSALYTHATAFVSASLMEGFGLPAIEAMAHGCLAIVSDIPAFREVCQENALYFNPKDITMIAQRLYEVAGKEKTFYKQKLANARSRVASFSWRRMAEETLKVYEGCISL